MRRHRINCPLVIERVSHHERYKDELLSLISQSDGETITNDNNDWISRGDYHYPENRISHYKPLFMTIIIPIIKGMIKEFVHETNNGTFLGTPGLPWFQQYQKYDTHSWHDHLSSNGSFLSIIHYLELPKGSPGTEFLDPYTGRIQRPKVKEGDVLMFPSFISHRSPPNQSNKRKTIISMNIK